MGLKCSKCSDEEVEQQPQVPHMSDRQSRCSERNVEMSWIPLRPSPLHLADLHLHSYETSVRRRTEKTIEHANEVTKETADIPTLPSGTSQTQTIDGQGRVIRIERYDVTLSIPCDALDQSNSQDIIYLRALTELPEKLILRENEMAVGVGFQGTPSGLRFEEFVRLTLPHCAILKDPGKLQVVLYTGKDEEISRSEITGSRCVVRENELDVYLEHFSWGILVMIYDWLFVKGKRIACTPFLPDEMPEDRKPVLHVRLYNQVEGNTQDILKEESSLKLAYCKVSPEQEIYIGGNSGDLAVNCTIHGSEARLDKVVQKADLFHLTKHTVSFVMDMHGLPADSLVTVTLTQEGETSMEFKSGFREDPQICHEIISEPDDQPDYYQQLAVGGPVVLPQILAGGPENIQQTSVEIQTAAASLITVGLVESCRDSDTLTSRQLSELSYRLPDNKFDRIAIELGMEYIEAQRVRQQHRYDTEKAYLDMLHRWQHKTGGKRQEMEDVLRRVDLSKFLEILTK